MRFGESGDFLTEPFFEGVSKEGLAAIKRAANAAGYDTANPQVQAALVQTFGQVATIGVLMELQSSVARFGDYLRDLVRSKRYE